MQVRLSHFYLYVHVLTRFLRVGEHLSSRSSRLCWAFHTRIGEQPAGWPMRFRQRLRARLSLWMALSPRYPSEMKDAYGFDLMWSR